MKNIELTMRILLPIIILIFATLPVYVQASVDTLKTRELNEVLTPVSKADTDNAGGEVFSVKNILAEIPQNAIPFIFDSHIYIYRGLWQIQFLYRLYMIPGLINCI